MNKLVHVDNSLSMQLGLLVRKFESSNCTGGNMKSERRSSLGVTLSNAGSAYSTYHLQLRMLRPVAPSVLCPVHVQDSKPLQTDTNVML